MNAAKTAPSKTTAPDTATLFEALLDAQCELHLLMEHFAEVTVPSKTATFGAITILD